VFGVCVGGVLKVDANLLLRARTIFCANQKLNLSTDQFFLEVQYKVSSTDELDGEMGLDLCLGSM
jgi:hypothetical protein